MRPTISKKNLLKGRHLYVILDSDILDKKGVLRVARLALSGGADILQLRDKFSSSTEMVRMSTALKSLTRKYKALFIVNDRLEVAAASDADGVHIGQGDIDIAVARKLLGGKKIIGVSIKNFDQAVKAKRKGADYLGVGPIFKTPIKPTSAPKGTNLIKRIKPLNIPSFAIGGIDSENIDRLVNAGIRDVAVIRAVCKARDPREATKVLKKKLKN